MQDRPGDGKPGEQDAAPVRKVIVPFQPLAAEWNRLFAQGTLNPLLLFLGKEFRDEVVDDRETYGKVGSFKVSARWL